MEILHTIAEISIALTGFAGIVFIFSTTGSLSDLSRWRIRNLLLGTITTMAAALIPLGFQVTTIPEDKWANVASWVLAFGIAIIFYSAVSGYIRYNVARTSQIGRRAFFPIMFAVVAIFVTQVFNGLGLFDQLSDAVFIYGLLLMLIINAIQFLISVLDRSQYDA